MTERLPWILLVISVALNAFFVGGYVYARVIAERVESPRGLAEAVIERLDLGPEQRELFLALREKRREARKRLWREKAEIREAFWDEIVREQADAARLEQLSERRLDLRRVYRAEVTLLVREFVETLNPEQRQAFAGVMKERLKRRRHRHR